MKKIFLSIAILFVAYFLSIFMFPVYADKIAELFGKTYVNENLRQAKENIESRILNSNFLQTVQDTKEKAVELQQNFSSGVIETQEKLETIKENINATRDAINQTTQGIDNTLNALDNLKSSVGEFVPSSSSGSQENN